MCNTDRDVHDDRAPLMTQLTKLQHNQRCTFLHASISPIPPTMQQMLALTDYTQFKLSRLKSNAAPRGVAHHKSAGEEADLQCCAQQGRPSSERGVVAVMQLSAALQAAARPCPCSHSMLPIAEASSARLLGALGVRPSCQ